MVLAKVVLLVALLVAALCDSIRDIQLRKKPFMKLRPYIACQVCEEVIEQIVKESLVGEAKENSRGRSLSEDQYVNLTDRVCHPYHPQGEWITHMDLVQEDGKLVLKKMDAVGVCHRECETVARTCQDLMAKYAFEIAEELVHEISQNKLRRKICAQECKKDKTLPKGSKAGSEKFKEQDEQSRKMFMQLVAQQELEWEQRPFSDDQLVGMGKNDQSQKEMAHWERKMRSLRRAKRKAKEEGKTFDEKAWEKDYDEKNPPETIPQVVIGGDNAEGESPETTTPPIVKEEM